MTALGLEDLERRRLELQAHLDAQKSQAARNKLGQFATPTELARDVVRSALNGLAPTDAIRFIDPALGTGSFFSALLSMVQEQQIASAVGFEVDPHYGGPSRALWSDTALELHLEDFTSATPPNDAERFNLLVCNPPYVRHHHLSIEEKQRLSDRSLQSSGVRVGGLAGLYCYFMALCHAWMSEDGVAVWLIPSEFMDVVYGRQVKQYLLSKVTLERIHRFDPTDVQFGDALVSSAVVWFRKSLPAGDHAVRFTYGGGVGDPRHEKLVDADALLREPKWSRFPMADVRTKPKFTIGDFFEIKRGVATGGNGFFIMTANKLASLGISTRHFRPILPSPRDLGADIVDADQWGIPLIENPKYLLHCGLSEDQLRDDEPALWTYLMSGKETFMAKYLCGKRTPWYAQEGRAPPPMLSTYMGRGTPKSGRPFRFILNRSKAIAANVYLLIYPRPAMARAMEKDPTLLTRVWEWLNGLDPKVLLGEGRVYGGGLYKLEPRELGSVPADWLEEEARNGREPSSQGELFAVEQPRLRATSSVAQRAPGRRSSPGWT